jgi:hypothetical protein
MSKKFRIYLETHPQKKSNKNALIEIVFIETERMIKQGDIIDVKSFYHVCEWQLWRVTDIVHCEKGTIALCEYIPNLEIDFLFVWPHNPNHSQSLPNH